MMCLTPSSLDGHLSEMRSHQAAAEDAFEELPGRGSSPVPAPRAQLAGPAGGRVGASISSSFSPRSSPGTAKVSSFSGADGPRRAGWAGRDSTPRSAASSAAWLVRIRRGARGLLGSEQEEREDQHDPDVLGADHEGLPSAGSAARGCRARSASRPLRSAPLRFFSLPFRPSRPHAANWARARGSSADLAACLGLRGSFLIASSVARTVARAGGPGISAPHVQQNAGPRGSPAEEPASTVPSRPRDRVGGMLGVVIRPPGPFQGKWITYRRQRVRPPDTGATCLRRQAGTSHPGARGWFYRRAELLWNSSAQLCPACLAALRRAEPG